MSVASILIILISIGLVYVLFNEGGSRTVIDDSDFELGDERIYHVINSNFLKSRGIWCIAKKSDNKELMNNIEKLFTSKAKGKSICLDNRKTEEEAISEIFNFISTYKSVPKLIQIEEGVIQTNLLNFLEGIIDDTSPTAYYKGEYLAANSVTVVLYTHIKGNNLLDAEIETKARDSVRGKWSDRFVQRLADIVVAN